MLPSEEYTEEIMFTKATNHFKLPVISNRATTTTKYIKSTSRPITFPQKNSYQMKQVSFPSTNTHRCILERCCLVATHFRQLTLKIE